jgi:hypothetical protein
MKTCEHGVRPLKKCKTCAKYDHHKVRPEPDSKVDRLMQQSELTEQLLRRVMILRCFDIDKPRKDSYAKR